MICDTELSKNKKIMRGERNVSATFVIFQPENDMKVHNNPRVFIKQQTKKTKKHVQIVPSVSSSIYIAQELKLIKRLAGNDPRLSEKELKKLGKWLQLRSNSSNRAYSLCYCLMI